MKRLVEPAIYIALLLALGGGVLIEGKRQADLEEQLPLTAQELYQKLARSQVRWQLVDVRPEPSELYEDAHIPGALPFPECDPQKTPAEARSRILASVPTVIVSEEGDPQLYQKCLAHFVTARNLAGGFAAWSDANYPEDSGEYVPPRSSAGGGCL